MSLYQGFQSEDRIRSNLKGIAQFLSEQSVDIACLQEVDADSHWNKRINLLETLKAEANYPHSIHGIHNKREGKKPLAYGNALLSQYEYTYWESAEFGNATVGEKGFLYAELNVMNRVLPIINIHLDFRSRKRRLEQADRILDFLNKRLQINRTEIILPPVMMGDFNTHSKKDNDAVAYLFESILAHGDYVLYPHGKRTFPSVLPARGLDFIMLPTCFTCIDCKVFPIKLSDHRPVYLEFEMHLTP